MVTWMAYAAVVAGLLAAAGLALERICAALGWPRRLAWLAVLTLAVVIPLTARPPETVAGGAKTDEPMATVAEEASLPEVGTPTAGERSGAGGGDTNPAPADRAALFVWSLATLGHPGVARVRCHSLLMGPALLEETVDRRRGGVRLP